MSRRASLPREDESGTSGPKDQETLKLIEQARKLEQLNSWFEVALNNMARGLSMFDGNERLIVCNSIYREIYELPDELTQPGTHISELVAYHAMKEGASDSDAEREHQRDWIQRHVEELALGKSFTHTQKLKNGRIILVTNQPLADGGWVDIQEDVTEKTRAEEKISWLARHDPLTETANRFHIREILEEEIENISEGSQLAIHWIDLDRFKEVNDTLGHAAGDDLLKSVAARMRSTVRDHDFVGRLGGDEFAVIQTGLTSRDQVESLAKRLLAVLNAPYRVLGQVANIGASIGVVMAPDHGRDADALLKKADVALYQVKTSGRGNYQFYVPGHESGHRVQLDLERDIRTAAELGQLEMHYQPIVDVATQRVACCEALMRWHHPTYGLVSPSVFIPLAEKTGAINEIGQFALQQACADAAAWPEDVRVTVNFSGVQIETSDVFGSVSEALTLAGLDPCRLEIEVTESVLLRDEKRAQELLEKLSGLGVSVSLDDFGTAFSSLSYLKNFSFDKVKIDQSFVGEMSDRKDCLAIVNAVAGLARSLEIGSVAEGVETKEQLQSAKTAGCREVQGFYFSKPVPVGELNEVFANCGALLNSERAGETD
jgi:diguanylate cyclase (GGDEF)-like protein